MSVAKVVRFTIRLTQLLSIPFRSAIFLERLYFAGLQHRQLSMFAGQRQLQGASAQAVKV